MGDGKDGRTTRCGESKSSPSRRPPRNGLALGPVALRDAPTTGEYRGVHATLDDSKKACEDTLGVGTDWGAQYLMCK